MSSKRNRTPHRNRDRRATPRTVSSANLLAPPPPDVVANGVKTPFLLADVTVAKAYGTLGKGMHAGLPGHSFVLIDKHGRQVWYGEYPSMWVAPQDLLHKIQDRLS